MIRDTRPNIRGWYHIPHTTDLGVLRDQVIHGSQHIVLILRGYRVASFRYNAEVQGAREAACVEAEALAIARNIPILAWRRNID